MVEKIKMDVYGLLLDLIMKTDCLIYSVETELSFIFQI